MASSQVQSVPILCHRRSNCLFAVVVVGQPSPAHWLGCLNPYVNQTVAGSFREPDTISDLQQQTSEVRKTDMQFLRAFRPRYRRRRGQSAAQSIDALESRLLLTDIGAPTGDATVFLENGSVIIDNAQGTVVTVEGGELVAAPKPNLEDATVNGGNGFRIDLGEFTGDIRVRSGFVIHVEGLTVPGDIVIDDTADVTIVGVTVTGDVDITETAFGTSLRDNRVHGNVTLQMSDARFLGARGASIQTSSIGKNLAIRGTTERDIVSLNEVLIHGETTIRTGLSDDQIALKNVQAESRVLINTGAQPDIVTLSNNEMAKRTEILGGKGADDISSTNDSFVGKVILRGGNGRDALSVHSPTFWGNDESEVFDTLLFRGEGGEDRYELEGVQVTEDGFTASRRGTVVESLDQNTQRALGLANSVYPTTGGLGVKVRQETEHVYIVTYPVRSAEFFSEGRPKVRVDLAARTAEVLPPDGGRERPVEFIDVVLDEDWRLGLPN